METNIICNAEEAVIKSYEKGFDDGYDTAIVVVETISKELNYNSDNPLLQGVKKAKQGAYKYMGCPPALEKVVVSPDTGKTH